jgi:predicted site-specific integrase-resolvase
MDDLIQHRYLSGESTPQIAKALAVSVEVVRQSLIRAGIPRRGRRMPVDSRFRGFYDAMMPLDEIASRLGVSIRVIKRWIDDEGLTRSRSTMNSNAKTAAAVSKSDLEQTLKDVRFNLTSAGRTLGVSRATIRSWMRKYGIPSRFRLPDTELRKFAGRPTELASQYGIARSTARRWLDKYDIKRPRREDLICPPDFDAKFLSGETRKSLADHYRVSRETINVWIVSRELSRRFPLKIEPPDLTEVTRLYREEKLSTAAIGGRYGVSDVTVQKWLASIGVDRNLGFVSAHEDEIITFLNSHGGNFAATRKVLGRNRELDGYDEARKLAIEYCGLWWHCEAMGKDRLYHMAKHRECADRGISLITVFQDEWTDRRSQVQSFLRARMGVFEKRIGARACSILPHADPDVLEGWHIQGRPMQVSAAFGLMHEGDRVGIVTFSPHHRGTDQLTLNRLAFKPGVQVIGGASKLIRHALQVLQQPVVTWSDNRWSTGELYRSVGFTLDRELPPDYSYTDGTRRRSKQSCKKSQIGCPKERTERDFMIEQGWHRIWDCGKRRWRWRP